MKNREQNTIGLLALGRVPEILLKIISAHISGYLNFSTRVLPPLALPEACLDKKRLQYDAARLIQYLQSRSFADCSKVIALIEGDLFIPIFTHVFGEAQQGGTHAVISLFRLQYQENGMRSPEPEFFERTTKVVFHELGHLFNLFHCQDPQCFMHFSGSIETLDAISMNFCPYCTAFINEAGPAKSVITESDDYFGSVRKKS